MSQTLTFTKVFTAEGAKNGKAWKRWDYKTADGEKYSSFKDLTGQITIGEPCTVEIEVSASNGYTNRTITGVATASVPATQQQETSKGSEAVRTAPVASQGPSEKDILIFRQTASKVAAECLPLFPAEEQTTETLIALSKRLVHLYSYGE